LTLRGRSQIRGPAAYVGVVRTGGRRRSGPAGRDLQAQYHGGDQRRCQNHHQRHVIKSRQCDPLPTVADLTSSEELLPIGGETVKVLMKLC